jgi:hypothetical protein
VDLEGDLEGVLEGGLEGYLEGDLDGALIRWLRGGWGWVQPGLRPGRTVLKEGRKEGLYVGLGWDWDWAWSGWVAFKVGLGKMGCRWGLIVWFVGW